MTVIAYHKESRQLAADRLFSICDTPVGVTKIFQDKFSDILFGAAGSMDNANMFYDWIKAGRPDDRKPQFISDQHGLVSFTGMVIEKGEIYRYEKGLFKQHLDVPFWAIGSGGDYAFGAMAMGADSKKAVEVAIKFDICSGLGIDVLHEMKP
jgi:hypothetical protein